MAPEIQDLTQEVIRLGDWPFTGGDISDIYRCSLRGSTVGVKILRGFLLTSVLPASLSAPEQRKDAQIRLTRLLRRLGERPHPNLVQVLGLCNDFGTSPGIVTSWYQEGNIVDYTMRHPEASKLHLLALASSGLAHLHTQIGIAHGSLRGSNVLISITPSGPIALLSDSALETITARSEYSTVCSRPLLVSRWLAPELFTGAENFDWELTSPFMQCVDIYSAAMTIVEVLSGKKPYCEIKQDPSVVLYALRGERPSRASIGSECRDDVWALLQCCWGSPEGRPNAIDLREQLKTIASATLDSGNEV
ncbi:kinase-like domain-containing protein [Flagelloscypha sp. PMI_526]|nr:kinase-like domain-containing protein [Flagelloscypha sp. PMI_526]